MHLFEKETCAIIFNSPNRKDKLIKLINTLKSSDNEIVVVGYNNYKFDSVEAYETLKDVPYNIDVVIILEESLSNYEVLDEMELLDIKNICFLEESFSEHILKKSKDLKLNILNGISLTKNR